MKIVDIKEKIKENIAIVRGMIADSAAKAGRRADEISLVAVTKTRTVDEMRVAEQLADFIGENRVQEAQEKKGTDPWRAPWRMIGSLQRNKVKKSLELFDFIDSVNSEELAMTLQRELAKTGRIMPVLMEINMSLEESKTGLPPEMAQSLADTIMDCPALRLDGLMTIGPHTDDPDAVRRSFVRLRELAETLRASTGLPFPTLSMGMSGDFTSAVEEGATLVRIGTSLFGKR